MKLIYAFGLPKTLLILKFRPCHKLLRGQNQIHVCQYLLNECR